MLKPTLLSWWTDWGWMVFTFLFVLYIVEKLLNGKTVLEKDDKQIEYFECDVDSRHVRNYIRYIRSDVCGIQMTLWAILTVLVLILIKIA